MLAVARILRTGAHLLLLDEISEGLAPVIVNKLAEMIRTLKAKGYTIVMVEQNFRFAAPLADRFYVMEHGTIVESFPAAQLRAKEADVARASWSLITHRLSGCNEGDVMKLNKICAALAACGLAFGMSAASAQKLSGDKIVIGFITDMSSLYSDIDGPGGVEAIRMAIADMQKEFPGKKIEVVFADHQNKADIASSKVREWIDQGGADVIIGGTNSATALARREGRDREEEAVHRRSAPPARV